MNREAANVAVERGRLKLSEYLQRVSKPAVYAAGDAARLGPRFTPVSSHHAKVVTANLLEGNHRTLDYPGELSVAFPLPPIGIGESTLGVGRILPPCPLACSRRCSKGPP